MKIKTKIFLIFFVFAFLLTCAISYFFYIDISKTKFREIRDNAVSIASSAGLLIDEQKHSKLLRPENMKSSGPRFCIIYYSIIFGVTKIRAVVLVSVLSFFLKK